MGSASSVHSSNDSLASLSSLKRRQKASSNNDAFTSLIDHENNFEKEAHSSDSDDTLAESEYPYNYSTCQYFELINLDLKTKAEILREQTFERKIYLRFLKNMLWKNRIAPEFRRLLSDASQKHLNNSTSWQTNKISSSAKQICKDELAMDNSLHSSSSLEHSSCFTLLQLQSILIVCTLKSFFQIRSSLDFTVDNLANKKENFIGQLNIVPSYTQDEYDDDGLILHDNEEYDQQTIDYSNDPELLLQSIVQDSSESDLEELLISGNWMHTIMQMFECLPFQMNIFHIVPSPSNNNNNNNSSIKLPNDFSLLYSNKDSFAHEHSLYTDLFELNNPSELSQQAMDCLRITMETKKMMQKTLWDKKNIQSKPLFTTFLPLKCKRSPHDFPPTFFSSTSTRPVDDIIEFDSIVTLHLDTQTLYTSRSLYQSLDLLLFSIAMLV